MTWGDALVGGLLVGGGVGFLLWAWFRRPGPQQCRVRVQSCRCGREGLPAAEPWSHQPDQCQPLRELLGGWTDGR